MNNLKLMAAIIEKGRFNDFDELLKFIDFKLEEQIKKGSINA